MKRIITLLFAASILSFQASGQDTVKTEQETCATGRTVQELIQLARHGEAEGYRALAMCYRDGNGVEKSLLNSICMYGLYMSKAENATYDIAGHFSANERFMLIYSIIDTPEFKEEGLAKLERLKQIAPSEAKAIEAVAASTHNGVLEQTLTALYEAEAEGSEAATIFLIMYHNEDVDDESVKEIFLAQRAERYPVLYVSLGDIYAEKYAEDKNFSDVQKAIDYYYKTDEYGMLTPGAALKLLYMYEYFGDQGMLKCDMKEIERLKTIAKESDSL